MGGSVWPFLAENAIFGKCSDWLETPLKRCASTRAFEWCNRRVNPWPTSKVMAKLLKPYYASSRSNVGPDVRRRRQEVVQGGLEHT